MSRARCCNRCARCASGWRNHRRNSRQALERRMTPHYDFDTIIVGGGPGGSTTGAFLARAGLKVLLLEKETFPRFHIGESLLPFGNDVLKASGAWPKIQAAGFIPKMGADFCVGNASKLQRLWFTNSLTPEHGQTYQVERSKFDTILFEHAAACG